MFAGTAGVISGHLSGFRQVNECHVDINAMFKPAHDPEKDRPLCLHRKQELVREQAATSGVGGGCGLRRNRVKLFNKL